MTFPAPNAELLPAVMEMLPPKLTADTPMLVDTDPPEIDSDAPLMTAIFPVLFAFEFPVSTWTLPEDAPVLLDSRAIDPETDDMLLPLIR